MKCEVCALMFKDVMLIDDLILILFMLYSVEKRFVAANVCLVVNARAVLTGSVD